MSSSRSVSVDEARAVGAGIGVDFDVVSIEEFRRGLEVELEHGTRWAETNVTSDDMSLTGKIAWAHLKEFGDYYTRLDKMEAEAEEYWDAQG